MSATLPETTINELARILGPTLIRVAHEMRRNVAVAETADEVLSALHPGWHPLTTRTTRPDKVETAHRLRPDLFEGRA